ncbi:MAG: hypothetical protein NT029_13600 [Armatimonadetes bacterium]|nr:hypothetical protein [Armatimonadota bacterium]
MPTTIEPRRTASFRLRPETSALLDALAQDTGLTRTSVIELAVRDLAKLRRVTAPGAGQSLLGLLAGVPGGSVEFLDLKHADRDREDRRSPVAS